MQSKGQADIEMKNTINKSAEPGMKVVISALKKDESTEMDLDI